MIFPDRVLGRASVNRIWSGFAMAPISVATWSRSVFVWASSFATPAPRDTKA